MSDDKVIQLPKTYRTYHLEICKAVFEVKDKHGLSNAEMIYNLSQIITSLSKGDR